MVAESSEAALVAVLQLHVSRPPGDVLVFLFGPYAPVTPAAREFVSLAATGASTLQFVVRPGQDDIDNLHRLLEEKQEPRTIMNLSL